MLSYTEILQKYPQPVSSEAMRLEIVALLKQYNIKIVVLDDDPTGIQTVNGCSLLTNWKAETIELAFGHNSPMFYVLTNSRAMGATKAEQMNREIVQTVLEVNKRFCFRLIFISRSDSTLRGHFPVEPDTMASVLRKNNLLADLPMLFIPAFLEAGRMTVGDIHYMKDGNNLVPVAETEFARDNVFGYSHSNLKEYIEEKTLGKIKSSEVATISLESLRANDKSAISFLFEENKGAKVVAVNAVDYADLRTFAIALLSVFPKKTGHLVIRTSSSFPKAIAGIEDKPLLTKSDLVKTEGVGVFIVGSHVQKTTAQLQCLLGEKKVKGIELDVLEVLQNPGQAKASVLHLISETVTDGLTPVIYTSRKEIRLEDKSQRLNMGQQISDFLVSIVSGLPFQPSYLIAKGGITSNDILTKGLCIETAKVMGQIISGVPVIQTGEGHRLPNLPYIIFPGNVGDETALQTVFNKLA